MKQTKESIMAVLAKVRLSDYCKYFSDINFDPTEQLMYIESMVEEFRKQEEDEEKKIRSINKDRPEDVNIAKSAENHYGFINMRNDALRSSMQIGLIAPAIEGLFKKSLYILIVKKLGEEKLDEYFKNDTGFKSGVAKRILKAIKDLKIRPNFPDNIENILSALFDYRNELFHNGLEWADVKCRKFLNEKYKKSWFVSHSSSCGLYFILPTREFIDESIKFMADSIDGFTKSIINLQGNAV